MRKDNAKDYLPFVKALTEGKTIQAYSDTEWSDQFDLLFTLPPECYRVKPEPMVIWVKAYKGQLTAHFTEAEARLNCDSTSHGPIKFIQADP